MNKWFTYSDETIDGKKSKSKAYALFDNSLLNTLEVDYSYYFEQEEGGIDFEA
jgi:hypothetical protein